MQRMNEFFLQILQERKRDKESMKAGKNGLANSCFPAFLMVSEFVALVKPRLPFLCIFFSVSLCLCG